MRSRIGAAIRRHRLTSAAIGVLLLVALVVGAALFQPWRIFTSSMVDEALPGSAVSATASAPAPASSGPAVPEPGAAAPTQTPAQTPTVLSSGAFQSQEHTTTGTASLLRLPDGSHVVRLENLASSDGPDVKIWLSSLEAGGDWFKYRSGSYLDLGLIKATHGNQNYAVPPGTDLSGLTTVVLWCDRFSVAFGSAALR
ncbi:DM13 domain-containing protein [Arthrobacter cavernae]|uniref:DM13 domain-containing protein n=1 Tax=Arthrobacter cavernae TaxID=2817681 RepID=A0A939HEP2_9MICC|nr:DM13 domain-containing protein [Arthrobacter cavernae]MBO1266988.1 DM13 domain-containing protein [Arthrobacter cavernae]